MIIKDELYRTVEYTDLERKIIDCADFQRLRRIKQMAFTYLVYPGATHSRFEHCIGTVYLASTICDKLSVSKEDKEKIRLYALLHDLGHVAFSHEGERVLQRYLGDHEEIGRKKVQTGEIADAIKENYSPQEILNIENESLGKIVTSDLGADRMDYLQRDAQNTGVAYGIIDVDRIIHTLRIVDGELCIEENGLVAAESLLIARFMMFSTVYLHKTVRIAARILEQALLLAIEEDPSLPEKFLSIGDEEAMLEMRKLKKVKNYLDMLWNRKLYKEAYSLDAKKYSKKDVSELEEKLKEKTNADVLLDYPHELFKPVNFKVRSGPNSHSLKSVDMKINTDNGLQAIDELSVLVKALKENAEKRNRILVLTKSENRQNVLKAAKELI